MWSGCPPRASLSAHLVQPHPTLTAPHTLLSVVSCPWARLLSARNACSPVVSPHGQPGARGGPGPAPRAEAAVVQARGTGLAGWCRRWSCLSDLPLDCELLAGRDRLCSFFVFPRHLAQCLAPRCSINTCSVEPEDSAFLTVALASQGARTHSEQLAGRPLLPRRPRPVSAQLPPLPSPRLQHTLVRGWAPHSLSPAGGQGRTPVLMGPIGRLLASPTGGGSGEAQAQMGERPFPARRKLVCG